MKECKIMRGLPGSGKSTLARLMAWAAVSKGYRAFIASADDYFCRPDGRYSWKGDELGFAHDWAKEQLQKAVSSGHDLVIVDNCNMKHSDYGSYAAIANGYDISLEVIGMPATEADLVLYASRNRHGVSLEAIEALAAFAPDKDIAEVNDSAGHDAVRKMYACAIAKLKEEGL